MRSAPLILALVVCLWPLSACRTVQRESPANSLRAVPSFGKLTHRFEVHASDRGLCGQVLRFEDQRDPSLSFWCVRNQHGQDLGLVDALGRAWKYVPYSSEAQWLGSGTVAEGAASILGIGSALELREVALEGD